MRLDVHLLGRQMKAGSAINAIIIQQRHGRHPVFVTHRNQFFRRRRAAQETKRRSRV
jgi:hypothetical protein